MKEKIKESIEAIARLRQLEADKAAVPACDELHEKVENAFNRLDLCIRTRGPSDRRKRLEATYKTLLRERVEQHDNPLKRAQDACNRQAEVVHRIGAPYIRAFLEWSRAAMQVSPYDTTFVGAIQKAGAEIGGMGPEPLERIIERIKFHKNRIEGWTFTEKPKSALPLLRLQDAASA